MFLPVFTVLLLIVKKGASLQCFECSHNELTDRGNLGSFYEWFKSVADNEHCTLEQEGDRGKLSKIQCPEEEGKIAKCVQIQGDVTTVTSFYADMEIKYKTITRDCVLVPEEDENYSDGCHRDFPSPGPVRQVLQTTLESNVIQSLTFDGTVCYGTESLFTSTSGAQRTTWQTAMLTLSAWCLLLARWTS